MTTRGEAAGAPVPDLPRSLSGARRRYFARLVANGTLQATSTIGLAFAISSQATQPSVWGIALLAGLAGVLTAARAREFVDAERLGLDYVAEVRMSLFENLVRGGAKSRHGVAMSRMVNDLAALKNWIGLGFPRLIVAGLALAGCLAGAALISSLHVMVLLGPIVMVAVVSALAVGPLMRRVGRVRQLRGRLAAHVGEGLLARSVLVTFGQSRRACRRVARDSDALTDAQARRMGVGGLLRAIPETVLPLSVVLAVAVDLPMQSSAIGIVLLAGLAIDPIRKALRAIEYRAAFVVARQRLRPGLADIAARERRPGGELQPAEAPGLRVLRGPRDAKRREVPVGALHVTADAAILSGTLFRNIDVTRRWRENDAHVAAIASLCQLDGPGFAPDGLKTRLWERDPRVTEAIAARLALARALAAGIRQVCVDAPVLLVDADGWALLKSVPAAYPVTLYVLAGDGFQVGPGNGGEANGRPWDGARWPVIAGGNGAP
ncbi:MAG: ABC transporter ATP-binding protein [Rhodospirillaceae bacterium]|nr:ABC transporter ATP-binding protein [Rhodospirillaceae bacterium]